MPAAEGIHPLVIGRPHRSRSRTRDQWTEGKTRQAGADWCRIGSVKWVEVVGSTDLSCRLAEEPARSPYFQITIKAWIRKD
jgi:hypothetical protein